MSALVWLDGEYQGDNRRIAMCGRLGIGAVFLPQAGGRYVRWRAWCTVHLHAAEGAARSLDQAKAEVERRFEEFLLLADLEPARKAER